MSESQPAGDANRATGATSACTHELTALVSGDLAAWAGLPQDCTRAQIETVLRFDGPANARDSVWTGEVHYHPAAATPNGVTVHYENDRPVYLLLVSPKLSGPLSESLGKPEAVLPSQLAGATEQWVYASRGLDAYVSAGTNAVVRLYGFAPTTVDEFREWGIAHVKVIRDPARGR